MIVKKMGWWIKDTMQWWANYVRDFLGEITAFPGKMLDRLLGLQDRVISYPLIGYLNPSEGPISSILRQIGRFVGKLLGGIVGSALGVVTFWLGPFFQKTPQEKLTAKLKELGKLLRINPIGERLGLNKDEIEFLAEKAGEGLVAMSDDIIPVIDAILPSTKVIAELIAVEIHSRPLSYENLIPEDAKEKIPAQLRNTMSDGKKMDELYHEVERMTQNPVQETVRKALQGARSLGLFGAFITPASMVTEGPPSEVLVVQSL